MKESNAVQRRRSVHILDQYRVEVGRLREVSADLLATMEWAASVIRKDSPVQIQMKASIARARGEMQ